MFWMDVYDFYSHTSVPTQMWTIYIALIEIAHLTTYTKWLLLYEWESQAFFPVGRGIWFEPRAFSLLWSFERGRRR